MFITVIQNLALLIFAGIGAYAIFSVADLKEDKHRRQVMIGLMMGVMVFLISSNAYIVEGILAPLDGKAGILVYAGYLGGPVGGVIAACFGAVARYGIGGPNVWIGMGMYGVFALFGASVSRICPSPVWPEVPKKAVLLLVFGAMLLQFLPGPITNWNEATDPAVSFASEGLALVAAGALSTIIMSFAIFYANVAASTLREGAATTLRLRLAASAANLGVFERSLNSDFVTFDEGIANIFGLEKNEGKMHLRQWLTFIFKEDLPVVLTSFTRVWQGNPPREPTLFRIVRADGEIRHVQAHWATEPTDGAAVKRVIGIYEDVTFSVETQLKSVKAETRLNTAVRIAGIGLYTFGAGTGDCTFCSEQHAAHMGMTPVEFQRMVAGPNPYLGHIHTDDQTIVLDAIKRVNQGLSQTFEYRVIHPKGDIRYIRQIEEPVCDENGKVIEHIGTSLDLTDLRQAEMRLRQSQRIEAIGTLTGGISHDFNNLLAIILGNLEIWLETGTEDQGKKQIETAFRAALRGADLTKNLLSFSRQAPLHPVRVNLNKLFESTLDWTVRVLPATITIEESLFGGLWDIEADAVSAENAFINLVLNARDAMPDGGTVKIETANIEFRSEDLVDSGLNITPGPYVGLTISDTGHGIAPDKAEQVFEPFYTDKPLGKGSGLGLSMVQGFVEQSGGAISLSSEVGTGTTFKLYFKAAVNAASAPEKAPHEQRTSVPSQGTILVVEDEPEVLKVLAMFLESAGYSVLTAKTGDEALGTFTSANRIDLLLTDVVMPGTLQGPALITAIRQIWPELPCIILSGYASDLSTGGNTIRSSDIHLVKPVSRSALLEAVATTLASQTLSDGASR
jgi:signal transduction histidine kinase/CheY-like chemotaxis protein